MDEMFASLANRHRRCTLYELFEHDGSLSLVDLAARVASWERAESRGHTVTAATSDGATDARFADPDVEEIRLSLHHVHLPKMVDVNLVAYDRQGGTIRLLPRGRRAEEIRRMALARARV